MYDKRIDLVYHRSECKACEDVARKQYWSEHRTEKQAYNKQYWVANRSRLIPEHCLARERRGKEYNRRYSRDYFQRHPETQRMTTRRRKAQRFALSEHFTEQEWDNLCVLYGRMCLACFATDMPLTPDHVIPLSRGGTDTTDNIQPLCGSCNSRKYAKTVDYRWHEIHGD